MSDQARSVAFNPAAPESERFDAMAELQKAHRPTASSLIPSDEIMPVIRMMQTELEERELMAKAGGMLIPFPARMKQPARNGMRSIRLDDMQASVLGDYYDKQTALTFEPLRDLVLRTPMLSSIVATRVRQVTRFCQPSEDGGLGFTISHEDPHKTLEGEDKEAGRQLCKFFKNCGWEFDPRARKRLKRDTFTQFMAKSVWDSLSMDSAPIETEMKRGRDLGMDGFYAVDGTTIRLCTEEGYQGDDEIYALQVLEGRVVCSYDLNQLVYEVRNPRADVRIAGYGMAEPELMVKIITGWLNAVTYNTAGFDQNAIPKGLLHLVGNYGNEDVIAFKRYWNMMVKGVNNAWSLPVMVSKDQDSKVSFEKFNADYDEMMFSKWITFLTSIACAIYGIAPDEINFESFAASKSTLSGSDTETKLTESKDKGLRPLLSYYEALFTDYFVGTFSDHLCFRWVGLDDEDPKQKWEEDKLALTWGELRARRGDPPLKDPEMEDMPVNPSFIGPWQAKQQAAQQAAMQQQPDYGDEGAGGDFGGVEPGAGDAPPDDDTAAAAEGGGAAVDGGSDDVAGQEEEAGGDGTMGKALGSAVYRLAE